MNTNEEYRPESLEECKKCVEEDGPRSKSLSCSSYCENRPDMENGTTISEEEILRVAREAIDAVGYTYLGVQYDRSDLVGWMCGRMLPGYYDRYTLYYQMPDDDKKYYISMIIATDPEELKGQII